MAVQWNGSRRPGPYSTTPSPRASSNSATSPTMGFLFTGRSSVDALHVVDIGDPRSVHDLRQGQFDDVRGPPILEGRDEDIDLGLGDDGLDRESPTAEELGHGR